MVSKSVGDPVQISSGPLAGSVFCAELQELQKADHTRKYVNHFMVGAVGLTCPGPGTERRDVVDEYDDFTSFGFLCYVDLFPIPTDDCDAIGQSVVMPVASVSTDPAFKPFPSSCSHTSSAAFYPFLTQSSSSTFGDGSHPYPLFALYSGLPPTVSSSRPVHISHPSESQPQCTDGWDLAVPTDVVGIIGDHVLTEGSKRTSELAGATVVSACTLTHEDKNAMMFVFSDIAVKAEGMFCLRYRALNLFSTRNADNGLPVLAECFGGPFRVYSTKDFPGLRPSTDLTKQISKNGVRLNARENVRKRRRKTSSGESETSSSPTSASASSGQSDSATRARE